MLVLHAGQGGVPLLSSLMGRRDHRTRMTGNTVDRNQFASASAFQSLYGDGVGFCGTILRRTRIPNCGGCCRRLGLLRWLGFFRKGV